MQRFVVTTWSEVSNDWYHHILLLLLLIIIIVTWVISSLFFILFLHQQPVGLLLTVSLCFDWVFFDPFLLHSYPHGHAWPIGPNIHSPAMGLFALITLLHLKIILPPSKFFLLLFFFFEYTYIYIYVMLVLICLCPCSL